MVIIDGDHCHTTGSHTQWILSSILRCIHVQVYPTTARVVVQPAHKARHLLFATKTNDNCETFHLMALTHNPDMFSLHSVHVQLLYSCTSRGVIQQFQIGKASYLHHVHLFKFCSVTFPLFWHEVSPGW